MRTTLSLDDDVAAQLEAFRATHDLTFKDAVNSALRQGLRALSRPRRPKQFTTTVHDAGKCLVPSLDNVWELLDDPELDGNPRP
jgi:hypothetical protein